MGETGRYSMSSDDDSGRQPPCLMLVPRGFDAPQELVQGLRQRGVPMEEVGDAPAVMVALATRRYLSLVVVEPDAVLERDAMLGAVRRYHGPMPVWQYVADHKPRLVRLEPSVDDQPLTPTPEPRVGSADTRLAGGNGRSGAGEPAPRPEIAGRIGGDKRHTRETAADRYGLGHGTMAAPNGEGVNGADCTEPPPGPGGESAEPETGEPPEVKVTLSEQELAMLLDETFDDAASDKEGDR